MSYNRHVSSISVYFNSILESFLKVKGTLGANVKLIADPFTEEPDSGLVFLFDKEN